jgi:hypothetical protein
MPPASAGRTRREALRRVVVDQFRCAGRRFGEDPEPGEGVCAEVLRARCFRYLAAAQAPRSVGAQEEVGAHLVADAVGVGETHDRRVRDEVVYRYTGDAEPDVAAVALTGVGEVCEDVRLGVELGRGADQAIAPCPRRFSGASDRSTSVLTAPSVHSSASASSNNASARAGRQE